MDRRNSADAGFFISESENTPMHVGSVSEFEGPAPSYGDLVRLLMSKLHLVPRYRQRVRAVPLHLGRPLWVDDEHFQISTTCGTPRCPFPGGPSRCATRRRVLGRRLDMAKPPWALWLVEGLAVGRCADADIVLQDCRVPEADRLQDANSFKDTGKVLRLTRGGVAWNAVGWMMGAYEAAVACTATREQFGRPIGRFQLIQDHLAAMLGNITARWAGRCGWRTGRTATTAATRRPPRPRGYCTTRLSQTVAHGRELLDGERVLLEYDVARFFNDAEAFCSYEGSGRAHPDRRAGDHRSGCVRLTRPVLSGRGRAWRRVLV